MPDPEVACTTQDARRLHDGLMSEDERVAGATWGALHHLTDALTGKRRENTEDHFPTFAGRLKNLLTKGVSAHRGRGTYDTLPETIALPESDDDESTQTKEIEHFQGHEMNVHLIPKTVLFVPGDEINPPTSTEETQHPTLASFNMFASIGLAYQMGKTTIWTIYHPTTDGDTFTITDLRTKTGREAGNICEDSKEAKLSTAQYLAHIQGNLTLENYLGPKFTLSKEMWRKNAEGSQEKGPSNQFDPATTSEFRTLATETLERLSQEGIEQISQAADRIKLSILTYNEVTAPPGTNPRPLWPDYGNLFGASDASLNKADPSQFATEIETAAFSREMKAATGKKLDKTKHLEVSVKLRRDGEHIEKTLAATLNQKIGRAHV
jgi:hypothetical protein